MKNIPSRVKRILLLIAFSAVLTSAATACKHTANGAGQDIERAGEKIQEKTQ